MTASTVAAVTRVLPLLEGERPDDRKPRNAVEAPAAFAGGEPRSRPHRVTAPATQRAAKEAGSPTPRARTERPTEGP